MAAVNVGIVGIGGFGGTHLSHARRCRDEGRCRLAAVVIREEEREAQAEAEKQLAAEGVAIHRSFDEMLDAGQGTIDLVSIPCGIHLHAPMSIAALERGYHVYCEKPPAGTVADTLAMKEARDRAGRMLLIGFQHIPSPSIQRLKTVLLAGELGRVRKGKACIAGPRGAHYYGRNRWAGRLAVEGSPIYDSPMQNAHSHVLNNMLYLAGPSRHESAAPAEVYGENYRVQRGIESADTQFLRVATAEGAVLLFTTTHAVDKGHPEWSAEVHGEKGMARWAWSRTEIYTGRAGQYALRETVTDGDTPTGVQAYAAALSAVAGKSTPLCVVDNAMQHTMCVEKSFASSEGVTPVPDAFVESADGESGRNDYVPGILPLMQRMMDEEKSFFEAGVEWGRKSKTVD